MSKKDELINEQATELPPSNEEPKPKKKHFGMKYIINISLVLIFTVGAVVISLWGAWDQFVANMATANWWYILACLAMVLGYTLINALILYLFARLYSNKYKYHQALALDSIGTFYNAITPSASGGQFVQAYTYKKQGIAISNATSILVMFFIVYQIVLVLTGLVSLFVEFSVIMGITSVDGELFGWKFSIPMWPLIIIGFGLNLSVIGLLFLASYSKKFHHFLIKYLVGFLAKIRIVKKPDATRESLRVSIENFKIELKRLLSNIPFFILVFFLFGVYLFVKCGIPYVVPFVLQGGGYKGNFFDAVCLTNFHQMVTGLIPIPGGAGISELVFTQLFNSSYTLDGVLVTEMSDPAKAKGFISSAMLIWRFITFILPLIIAGFVTAFYKCSPNELEQKATRRTFVNLQTVTFDERKLTAEASFQTSQISKRLINKRLEEKKNKDNDKKDTDESIIHFDKNKLNENSKTNIKTQKIKNKKSKKDDNSSEWSQIEIRNEDDKE